MAVLIAYQMIVGRPDSDRNMLESMEELLFSGNYLQLKNYDCKCNTGQSQVSQ